MSFYFGVQTNLLYILTVANHEWSESYENYGQNLDNLISEFYNNGCQLTIWSSTRKTRDVGLETKAKIFQLTFKHKKGTI